jgi:chromosome segregation ATPase
MSKELVNLTLQDVQRHQKLRIDLTSGFNCIYGDNNKGKSAIVRAWNLLCNNVPAGDWVCRLSGDEKKPTRHTATIKAEFEDGVVIKRIKGKLDNKYTINGEEFTDINRGVPSEVKEVLDFSKVFDGVEENIFIRTDEDKGTPIVTGKSSIAGKILNELVGVEEYELAVSEFGKEKLALNKQYKFNVAEHQTTKTQLEKYRGLNELRKKFDKATELDSNITELKIKLDKLKSIYSKYKTAKQTTSVKIDKQELACIESLDSRYKADSKVLSVLKCEIDRYWVAKEALLMLPSLIEEAREMLIFTDEINDIKTKVHTVSNIVTLYKTAKKTLATLEVSKNEAMKEIQSMVGTVCPTCGNVLTEKNILDYK